ncbi:hypothetical protein BS50DRAFT_366633 [Corynespora cassiicola Philippines]|uniref:Uncharacterized protein n=1 Tax=Corynespora cassiicola Philippines TaxID=1448308 RepID=A0A2T2NSR4_CORCC|nr:hypothetical protein BS50DRAFT_366633 [Corynespora cassiicola Philippines]
MSEWCSRCTPSRWQRFLTRPASRHQDAWDCTDRRRAGEGSAEQQSRAAEQQSSRAADYRSPLPALPWPSKDLSPAVGRLGSRSGGGSCFSHGAKRAQISCFRFLPQAPSTAQQPHARRRPPLHPHINTIVPLHPAAATANCLPLTASCATLLCSPLLCSPLLHPASTRPQPLRIPSLRHRHVRGRSGIAQAASRSRRAYTTRPAAGDRGAPNISASGNHAVSPSQRFLRLEYLGRCTL